MSYPISEEARLVQLHEVLQGQRAAWWTSGRFSLETLAKAQSIAAGLSNYRDDSLAELTEPAALEDGHLHLSGIGWIDRELSSIDVPRRVLLVQQAIARLKDIQDAKLYASARVVAESLPNLRDNWNAKLAPLVAWAAKHREEILEEASV